MRDIRFRRLERHRTGGTQDRMKLSYLPPRSPSGKIYQFSPNPDAIPRLFMIGDSPSDRQVRVENQARTRRAPGPGQTVCPYTGHMADDDEFVHPADIETIMNQIELDIGADVSDWLHDLAGEFNRGQPRGSFITMKMEYKPRHRPRPVVIRADLLRDLSCDICARSYAVYAIALYCPDCGAPNLALHFKREVALVHEQLALASEQDGACKPELSFRLMGNAHEDVLTAFETTLKAVYRHLLRRDMPQQAAELCSKKSIGNVFQNIDRGREKYASLGIDPFAVLSGEALANMRLNIEKRHVIGHNLGIADEHYAAQTQTEHPGKLVSLIGGEIGRFADSCLAVISGLEHALLPNAGTALDAPQDE
ncbi:MAG: hypothetical protein F4Y02_00085 [Chloroflexi bacterium]|nr:hypothetical protein [Chloroflexota bacterium]